MTADRWRIADVTDAEIIRSLTRAAYAKWVPLIGREPKPMLADYSIALAQNRFDLLYAQEKLVGLIETLPPRDHLFVENIAVAPEWQGQGTGHRLLERAEQIAVAAGINEIRLNTNAAFKENIRLYRRVGYALIGSTEITDGAVVHMSKRLS